MKIMLDKFAIGKRISILRGPVTITEYSAKYSVARQTAYNWENGTNIPEIDTLAQMALDAGVRIDWLLFGLEPMRRAPAYDATAIASAVATIEQALQDDVIDLAPDVYGKAVVVALEDGNVATFAAEINTRYRFAARPRSRG